METFPNLTTTPSEGIESSNQSIGDVTWFRVLKYTLYAIMFLVSLPGNLMVCVIITRRRKMKTITNFLILNLAVSDVLYTLYVPLDIVVSESSTWPFARFFCKLFYPLMTLSICVSAFTLMALALSRFWAVVFPLHRQISVVQIKISLVVIWLLSVFQVLPYAIVLDLTDEQVCDELWPSNESKKTYTLSLFLLQFVIPLSAITLAYTMVGVELKKGSRRTENETLEKARNEESKKIIRMLIIVTVTFAFCNLPTSTMWMINDFDSNSITEFDDIVAFFNILDFANAAANPCIYLACNEDFRREFRRYLGKIKRKVYSTSSHSQTSSFAKESNHRHERNDETGEETYAVSEKNNITTDPSCTMLLKTSTSSV